MNSVFEMKQITDEQLVADSDSQPLLGPMLVLKGSLVAKVIYCLYSVHILEVYIIVVVKIDLLANMRFLEVVLYEFTRVL